MKDEKELSNGGEPKEDKKKDKKRAVLLVLAIIVFVCACVHIGFYIYNSTMAQRESEIVTTPDTTAQQSGPLADNPVDFKTLQQGNEDIYAWIKIDGTEIDYPIVQSPNDDDFYLRHSAYDKSWIASGAIYTQGANSKDFSDPVTVIYGHNGYRETMFTALHEFEDKEFFDSHEYFYIYMPGRKLTYQVVSAFKYDDRHIMNSFNFVIPQDLQAFQDTVTNPASALKNVRTQLDTQIDSQSKIVVLSTCITNQENNRYLVCGVLVKDEQTN